MKNKHSPNRFLIAALPLLCLVTIATAAPPIAVTSIVPGEAEQGTNQLLVAINGRGFGENSNVEFFVSGSCDNNGNNCTPGLIQVVGSIRFINAKKLEATIDVDDAAILGLYDVQVQSNGRRGRGTELFRVLLKGGGQGGNSEILVSTLFNCPTGIGRDCPDSSNPSPFQADFASTPYVDDVDNVKNRFNTAGHFFLTMHKRQNRPGTRKVFWKLPMTVSLPGGIDTDGTEDLESQGFNHKTVIQVGKFTDFDLRAIGPGDSAPDIDMLLDLYVFDGNKRSQNDIVLVRYSPDGSQCFGNQTSGVTVKRTDGGSGPRQWTITAAADSQACLTTLDTFIATFDFGPLVLTVTEEL